jgi:pSer/pThr/pTyr-binding forkhead associated (FHA) protein
MAAPSGQPVPTPPAVPVAAAPAPAAPPQTPTPPAGLRVGSGLTAKQASGGAAFAATMMPTSGQLDQILAGIPARGATGQTPAAPAAAPAPATPAAAEPEESGRKTSAQPTTGSTLVEEPVPTARLILVQSDGSDGTVYDLSAEQVDLGRLEGQLTFPDDRFLAARHARLERREDRYVVVPLDHRNGIYVRLREPVDLGDADTFLVGKQVFRFERLADVERDPAPAIEHGVHLFGTPGRQPWARLVQVTTAGIVRDVYYLTRAETVMGREEGDYVFPDDEFMSRRHVAISESRNRARIEDLGSSNGTYLRLRGERELRPGDMVRLGDQLLRYETIT